MYFGNCSKIGGIVKKTFIGITGASGVIYGLNLIKAMQKAGYIVHTTATKQALENIKAETGEDYKDIEELYKKNNIEDILIYDNDNLGSAVASGSFKIDNYIIAPASMGFIGRVACGISSSLIERCADVALKERRPIVMLFREMPLSLIHLENLTKLSRSGAVIMPAAPAFYNSPKSIDDLVNFVTGKVLDVLNIDNDLYSRWGN